MTTNITISPAGHRVQVSTLDTYVRGEEPTVLTQTLEPGSPAVTFYATTTREIRIVDLDTPAD